MEEESNLERVLQAFERQEGLFAHPRTLSFANEDVTVKYALSMLKLADNQTKQDHLIDSFCDRFSVDNNQMNELLAKSNNWMDYRLYTAFAVHMQQGLEMDDEKFHEEVTNQTFLDFQDRQIQLARLIPRSVVINGMNKQFSGWAKAAETYVATKEKKDGSFVIERWTLDKHRKQLREICQDENLLHYILRRDCRFTEHSFIKTFRELYGQQNLIITTIQSEADNLDKSIYEAHPSSHYRTLIGAYLSDFSAWFTKIFRPSEHYRRLKEENQRLQTDNDTLTSETHAREATIREMTEEARGMVAELERRQETIVDLATSLARVKSSGDRHGVRNFLNDIRGREEERIFNNVASQVFLSYQVYQGNQQAIQYLEELCDPFGIKENIFSSLSRIIDTLHLVEINGLAPHDQEVEFDESLDIDLEFLADIAELAQSYNVNPDLDDAYKKSQEVVERFKKVFPQGHPLRGFNPFEILFTSRSFHNIIDDQNARFKTLEELQLFDEFDVHPALEEAVQLAQKEKRKLLEVEFDLKYTPRIRSNRDSFIYLVRDLFMNIIDAGGTHAYVPLRRPVQEDNLPFFDSYNHEPGEFPALYMMVEDTAGGMPEEVLRANNEYLANKTPYTRSTKGKDEDEGGLGTRNLKKFLDMHHGQCFYENYQEENRKGTRAHIYLQRLSI